MAIDSTNPAVGDGTRRADYVRHTNNDLFLDGKPCLWRAGHWPGYSIVAGATEYHGSRGGGSTATGSVDIVGKACIAKNLRVQADGDPGAGKTIAVTIRYGATLGALADTTLTCTITGDGAAVLTASDVTHTVSMAAAGCITAKVVSGAGASTRQVMISVELESAV